MNRVYEALGTKRYGDETWTDLFTRVNREGGIDVKMLIKVVVAILEELEDEKRRKPTETVFGEIGAVSEGTRRIKKEVSGGTTDTKGR